MSAGYPEHDSGLPECLPVKERMQPAKREKDPELRDELLVWHNALGNQEESISLAELREFVSKKSPQAIFTLASTYYCTISGYCSIGLRMLLTQCGFKSEDFQGVKFYEICSTLIVSSVLGDREICTLLCSIIGSIKWQEIGQENERRLQHIVGRHMYQGTTEEPLGYTSEDGSGSESNRFAYFEHIGRGLGDTIYDPDPVLAVIKKELHIATCPCCKIHPFYSHTRDGGTRPLSSEEVGRIYQSARQSSTQSGLLGRVIQQWANVVFSGISKR